MTKHLIHLRSFLLLVSLIVFSFPLFSQDTLPSSRNNTEVLIGTFRGNDLRNYYGRGAPDNLQVVWKLYLGKGRTVISRKLGERIWAGAGWTGQPLLVHEGDKLFLIQGAYDHHLKKIDATTGRLVWQYLFDDVVKGTGTIWHNPHPRTAEEAYLILQGSRLGTQHYMDAPHIPSFRAISLLTGRELWRLDSKWTDSYSRDVDGSALIVKDTVYIGLENSLFTLLDPDPARATVRDSMLQPRILREIRLYHRQDVIDHKYNVVTESSPARLGRSIFITSGSGHVFRYNMDRQLLDWDFYTGSDMDGSPVVTRDSCILVSIEKQYIPGPGGVFKLDPRRPPGRAVVWFFPTQNDSVGSWEGGVIGTAAVNDAERPAGQPPLAAFAGIDGYLYLVRHDSLQGDTLVTGPDSLSRYPVPVLLDRYRIGPSISSPLISGDKLIAASYNGLFLFRITGGEGSPRLQLLDRFIAPFEATPIVWKGHLYLASRNGYLYCFGKQ
jgi:outer membrane protein assembly factor BamB